MTLFLIHNLYGVWKHTNIKNML